MYYPRNMVGYGQQPPNPNWPKNANIAVQFVLNYEEGGESCVLHGDQSSEAFLSEIVGAEPWPNQRHWNMESIYEYGARAGFWRLREIFDAKGIPITIYGVAEALVRSPVQVKAMIDSGWEIASHGLKWIEYKDFPFTKEKQFFHKAIKLHEAVTGSKPSGWYLGRCSANTIKIACEYGNFDYISDSYADDLPYWYNNGSQDNLIIPYTLDVNDMRFATNQGFNSGTQFYDYLKDTFDLLYNEGQKGSPKMMTVGLHCRLAGRPGRAQAIKKFIDYIQGHKKVWCAKRIDIAKFWKDKFPPRDNTIVPSKMTKSQFMSKFKNVFEHSDWVAAKTFKKSLSPQLNSSIGLHQVMCMNFRLESKVQKMKTLLSHPDLAGKLADQDKLTIESKTEQTSAGLNSLSIEQKKQFKELNKCYHETFGFPFILAVKNKNPNEILSSINSRIKNDRKEEFETACNEVEKIALYRLDDIFGQS